MPTWWSDENKSTRGQMVASPNKNKPKKRLTQWSGKEEKLPKAGNQIVKLVSIFSCNKMIRLDFPQTVPLVVRKTDVFLCLSLNSTNYGRDISRGIISRQKSGRVGPRSRSGRPPRFFDKSGSGRPPRSSSPIVALHTQEEDSKRCLRHNCRM